MITPKFDSQKYHEFNRLTTLPAAGGAMGESATTPTTQPVFARTGVYMKVIRRKGATTDFLQDSAKKYIDAAAANIEASLLSHVYDLANYILYGNATANAYEFSGLDTFIVTNRTNKTVGGVVPTSLKTLDDLIDANIENQGLAHKKAFVMSPQMLSKFSQLLTNVRLNQGLTGAMSQVDIPGGWRLNAYRDIPIIVSSACRPRVTMGTVTDAVAGGGSGLGGAATYYVKVAPVTIYGEQLASAEISRAVGTADTWTLTWTAVAGALRYKIYISTATGTETLKAIVPGFVYDANGTLAASTTMTVNGKVVGSDASCQTITCQFNSSALPSAGNTEVPTALRSDVPLVSTGGISPEYVFMWDLDEYQGLGRLPYTNEGGSRFGGLVTIEDLAKTDDFLPYLIKSYCAIADSFEKTSAIIRGLRVE